jgi:glyoxylase-like metal-dependent hydrolase (beta-lactamase superfamily II)
VKTSQNLFDSKHFQLQQLADGVYACLHADGGAAIGNAGIVDLGDRTLVYDTFFTPQAAEDLRAAAEALTGRPVDTAINSHYHNDHIWGNQVFSADTDILSTVETHRLIVATRGHDDYETFLANAEKSLASTQAQFEATEDEGKRRQLTFWLDYHKSLVEAKPTLQVRPPNLCFTQRMAFHGTDRSAELIAFDGGHSASDAVLWLPQERIAFLSDLLFIGCHPWVGAGDPEKLSHILDRVSDLGPQILVPGHGPVGTPDDLELMQQYVSTLDELVHKRIQDGEPESEIDGMAIPAPFEDWLFAAFYPLNMRFLYQRRSAAQTDASD